MDVCVCTCVHFDHGRALCCISLPLSLSGLSPLAAAGRDWEAAEDCRREMRREHLTSFARHLVTPAALNPCCCCCCGRRRRQALWLQEELLPLFALESRCTLSRPAADTQREREGRRRWSRDREAQDKRRVEVRCSSARLPSCVHLHVHVCAYVSACLST